MKQCLRFVLNENKLIEKTIICTVPVFGSIMLSGERNYFDEDFNFNWNMDKSWISLSTAPMIHRIFSSQFSFFLIFLKNFDLKKNFCSQNYLKWTLNKVIPTIKWSLFISIWEFTSWYSLKKNRFFTERAEIRFQTL
jgi:hypothetical protein